MSRFQQDDSRPAQKSFKPARQLSSAGAFSSAVSCLYWITYVRRVTIDQHEIRVKRGLSPFARRYALSDNTRILQMDCYLYLGRAGEAKLINPSLSPMLRTKEEARWVASEMRRTLNSTSLTRTSELA